MSGQHLCRQHHCQQSGKPPSSCLQQALDRPQRRGQPRATDDRPFPATATREPPVDIHQRGEAGPGTGHTESPGVRNCEHERQHVVQQVTEAVGGVDVQPAVESQMRRIEHTHLAFGQHRVSVTDPVVPERRKPPLQLFGVEDLLREVIRVNVAADESASGDQRPPEQPRQGDSQQPRHQRETTVTHHLVPVDAGVNESSPAASGPWGSTSCTSASPSSSPNPRVPPSPDRDPRRVQSPKSPTPSRRR